MDNPVCGMRRGYGVRMKRHPRIFATVVLITTVMTVAACAPTEEPDPTPTAAFASDEEAFAAAEETYRAYVDALNAAREGGEVDPLTFLVGDALTAGIDGQRLIEDQSLTITGQTVVVSFAGFSREIDVVAADVCIDVSETRVTAADGSDLTPASRPEQITYSIEVLPVDGILKIQSSEVVKESC